MLLRRHHQQNSDVLIQLNGLMHIELVQVSLLFVEAQVLEEEVESREEGVLQELGI